MAITLVIGNKNYSSWSLRPWLLLRHHGVPFTELRLLLDTPGFHAQVARWSPSRRVPALHDDALVVWDSLAICEYANERWLDGKGWPADIALRALARCAAAEMHSGFGALRSQLPMNVRRQPRKPHWDANADTDIARVQALWTECRTRTGDSAGPFLFGRFSIADAMFAPVVWRFRTYDIELKGAARAYYETMLGLPAMLEWERDAMAEVKALADAAASARPNHTPDPRSAQHCYAVIFSSQRTAAESEAYDDAATRMVELAAKQPGFLGVESARGAEGFGITVSYWDSLEAIRSWKALPEHATVQAEGKKRFYERYEVRVAVVERGYKFPS